MFLLLLITGTIWGLALLASARRILGRLPKAQDDVPSYALVLPRGVQAPTLDPPPSYIHYGEVTEKGPKQLLFLDPSINFPKDLPGRFAACAHSFVSIMVRPNGRLASQAIERLCRDFSGSISVNDSRSPAAFVDARCTWVSRDYLALPGPERTALMRAARAAKAFGQSVHLIEALEVSSGSGSGAQRLDCTDWFVPAPWLRWCLVGWLLGGNLIPLIALGMFEHLLAPCLVLVLAGSARLMTAIREDFGYGLVLSGFLLEPWLAWRLIGASGVSEHAGFPSLDGVDLKATGQRAVDGGRWLDGSGVAYLARRTGGSARVMAQIYNNIPQGRSALGLGIDRYIHWSPAARALRFRLLKTIELGRRIAPESILSIPSGQGRDARAIGAERIVLVDPDPWALETGTVTDDSVEGVLGHFDDLPEADFDLVLFIGLIEYLGDGEIRRHLADVKAHLKPHGAMLISTTQPDASMTLMRRHLGWVTRGRSPEEMVHLLEESGFRIECRASDPHELQWVFLVYPVWDTSAPVSELAQTK